MKYLTFLLIVCTSLAVFYEFGDTKKEIDLDQMSTGEILVALGDERIKAHLPDTSLKKVSAEIGRQLVLDGEADVSGGKRVSPYFNCTSCHNIQQETPSLTMNEPSARLKYANEYQIPYLQGSPLFGLVSRLTYYNGDYQKKYGDLAKDAYQNIREAIQLCATECSQGRILKDWELESMLAYFWTIDIPFSRLEISTEEMEIITKALDQEGGEKKAITLIQSKYPTAYPAHFIDPPKDRKQGNDYEGDVQNGKLLYTLSCLHCHNDQRYSLYDLDTTYMSLNQLARRMPTYHEESVYQVVRYGTPPLRGKKAYMPNYTKEKMSREQMADLRAYIFSKLNQ